MPCRRVFCLSFIADGILLAGQRRQAAEEQTDMFNPTRTTAAEPGSKPANRTYFGVQALRACAALLVVVYHSYGFWNDRVALGSTPHVDWSNTQAGVDVFFVISGFVMGVTTPGLMNIRHKAWVFLWRRFIRVVPLYWIFTTLKIIRLEYGPPSSVHESIGGWWQIVASYFFIPSPGTVQHPIPLHSVGWTLNFETFFYYLFAIALALEIAPLWFLAPTLGVIALVGWIGRNSTVFLGTPVSMLVLEFLFGVVIAHWTLQRRLPGRAVGWGLMITGWLALLFLPYNALGDRAFTWGLAAGAIVLGTVALEGELGKKLPRWLLELGNASYAIYLTHTFVASVLWVILLRLNLRGPGSLWLMVGTALVLACLTGELVHRLIELPILRVLRGGRVRGVSTLPPRPAHEDARAESSRSQ